MSPFYLSVRRILLNDPDLKVIVDPQSGPRSLIQLGADIYRHLSTRSDPIKTISHFVHYLYINLTQLLP